MNYITIFVFLIFSISAYSQIPEADRIFSYKLSTDKNRPQNKNNPLKKDKLEEIFYFVRMPVSWTPAKDKVFLKKNIPAVRGVLILCTWGQTESYIKETISSDGKFLHLVDFADQNNLALVTWSNFRGYSPSTSNDEMSKKQQAMQDALFEERLNEWERGFRLFFKRHNLPLENVLIYGFSGGAQMAHRIALRKPQYFSGIHIHVNSSYDVPTSKGKNIVWLVTTGELEYGYSSAQRFYKTMLDLGYSVIFKAGENLGHSTNPQINALSVEFFSYLLTFLPDYSNPDWTPPPVDKFYLIKYPAYIGDYLNQVVYPTEKASANIPSRHYMTPLPTKSIAKKWGTVLE